MLASAFVFFSHVSAQPAPLSPEAARVLAAGGCVLLDGTPTHQLAEVAREPEKFAGRRIRLRAVYEQRPEGAWLVPDAPAEAGRAIAVGLAPLKGPDRRLRERGLARIRSADCAGRSSVAVRGILRPGTDGGTFEIEQFDGVEPVGLPFTGSLKEGECYRAAVVFESASQFHLVTPLWVPAHHVGRIEWTNLRQLSRLRRPAATPPTQAVVFRVLSRQIDKVGEANRWHSTYRCRIYRID